MLLRDHILAWIVHFNYQQFYILQADVDIAPWLFHTINFRPPLPLLTGLTSVPLVLLQVNEELDKGLDDVTVDGFIEDKGWTDGAFDGIREGWWYGFFVSSNAGLVEGTFEGVREGL